MNLSFMAFMCEMPLLMEGDWTGEKSRKIEEIIMYAAKAGFRGVDLTAATVERIGAERVKAVLDKYDINLASLICFASLAEPDITDEEAQEPYIKAMDTASAFNCDHLMLVPGFFVKSEDTLRMKETLERRLRNVVSKASEKNIICMIEDDPDLKLGMCSAADVESFLKAAPGLKLVYDSANMIVAGEDPVDYFEQLKDYTVHMHIKDIAECDDPEAYRNPGSDGKYYISAPHGTGLVDFSKLFSAICAGGYDGWLSLEYVPSGKKDLCEEIRDTYRTFAALSSKCCVGVNSILLIPKLVSEPYENVWKKLLELGLESVELCVIPDHSERIRSFTEEAAKKYPIGMPPCLAKGDYIFEMAKGVLSSGLKMHSCHLLLCDAYPELIEESVPYMKEINRRTGVRQFVMSCNFNSVEMVEAFSPHIQKAASALAGEGITLCYHNHHMDSEPLENGKTAMEMVLENCPDCRIQLDVGWAWYGHMDSQEFMQKYGDRIVSVHLKDLTSDSRERTDGGRFTAIGAGAVPIRQALDNLHLCSISPGRLIIDQDESVTDIYGDIKSGIQFIRDSI